MKWLDAKWWLDLLEHARVEVIDHIVPERMGSEVELEHHLQRLKKFLKGSQKLGLLILVEIFHVYIREDSHGVCNTYQQCDQSSHNDYKSAFLSFENSAAVHDMVEIN